VTEFYAGDRITSAEELDALPNGSVVTTPFPDFEGNVAERASDGFWLVTGENALFTSADVYGAADAPITVLQSGYGD